MTQQAIIMAAPNGARKTHQDHPAIPLSISATVAEASACFQAGASVLHAHVRDSQHQHVLDAGLYRELLSELQAQVPQLLVQITTEAVGIYSPRQQVDCVQAVGPEMISVSLREMTSDFSDLSFASEFYRWCDDNNVHVQHILYSRAELDRFLVLRNDAVIPQSHRCVLFVLGRYAADFQSSSADLTPFLGADLANLDWFVCAFGSQEQACVGAAIKQGGHGRIGFENNLLLANGEVASSSAQLIAALADELNANGIGVASASQARALLGLRSA